MPEDLKNTDGDPLAHKNASPLRTVFEEFAIAHALLTRIPLPNLQVTTPATIHSSIWAYPIAGALIGAISAGVLIAAILAGLSSLTAIILAMLTAILTAGALHEDGWADFCDGIGGGKTRDDKLAIMRDSRIGAYGVIGLVFAMALQCALLLDLSNTVGQSTHDAKWRLAGLLVANHAMSRASLTLIFGFLPSARTDGLSANAKRPTSIRLIAAATIGLAICALAISGVDALVFVAGSLLGAGIIALIAKRRLQGYTGDVLGAAVVLSQICALIALAIIPSLA